MRLADLDWPLADFQGHVAMDESDGRKLVNAVSAATGGQLDAKQLDAVFCRFWPDLKAEIGAIGEPTEKVPTPPRPTEEMFAEILERIRALDRNLPVKLTGEHVPNEATRMGMEALLLARQRRHISSKLWSALESNVPPPLPENRDLVELRDGDGVAERDPDE